MTGEEFRVIRKEKKLSQDKLAEMLGYSSRAIQEVEKKKHEQINNAHMIQFMKLLHVLDMKDEKYPPYRCLERFKFLCSMASNDLTYLLYIPQKHYNEMSKDSQLYPIEYVERLKEVAHQLNRALNQAIRLI